MNPPKLKPFEQYLSQDDIKIRCTFDLDLHYPNPNHKIPMGISWVDQLRLVESRFYWAIDKNDFNNLLKWLQDTGATISKDSHIEATVLAQSLVEQLDRVCDFEYCDGAGNLSLIIMSTLLWRLKKAFSVKSGLEQNGGCGSRYDEKFAEEGESFLRTVVRDIAAALTNCEITFQEKKPHPKETEAKSDKIAGALHPIRSQPAKHVVRITKKTARKTCKTFRKVVYL